MKPHLFRAAVAEVLNIDRTASDEEAIEAIERLKSAASLVPSPDDERWKLIEDALHTTELSSDLARLAAISAIVNSRKPLTEEVIRRGQELADGWALPSSPGAARVDRDR